MKTFIFTALMAMIMTVGFYPVSAYTAEGMLEVKSSFGVKETGDRLERVMKEKGMTIFKRVKHSEAAKKVGVPLRETELIIFGNPEVGSPLMKCQQSVAIDLPQKALIFEDCEGNIMIAYNDPEYLRTRHHISDCEEVISKIGKAIAGIVKAAASD